MKLYMNGLSQNARKAQLTAKHLGLALDLETIDLATGQQRSPAYLLINPNGLLPALVDGEFVLWESNAICQYIADQAPGNSLWPNDARQRADIARWQFWEAAQWFPALFHFFRENMIKKFMNGGPPDAAVLKVGAERVAKYATVLDRQLSANRFLVGDNLSLADFAVSSHLMHAGRGEVPLAPYVNIKRWFDEIQALPAWKATEPAMAG